MIATPVLSSQTRITDKLALSQRTVLYLLDSEKYLQQLLSILKDIAVANGIIYVTTNRPYALLTNTLRKNQISTENMFFIDCISKTIGQTLNEGDPCLFVEGPQSLVDLSIAISESVKHLSGEKVLVLDSLSILLIYNDASSVGKFSNFLINKMRVSGVGSAILALESDIDKDIIKQIGSIVDEVQKVAD